jgi:hypothetical protein
MSPTLPVGMVRVIEVAVDDEPTTAAGVPWSAIAIQKPLT